MFVNKIGFFGNFQTQNKNNNLKNEKAPQIEPARGKYIMPTAAHYASNLSFTGGYSINLKETVENLEKYEKTHCKEIFPPNVKEKAKEVIKGGNPDDLTLIDIHKEVYNDVLDIDNLEDLKLFYPEFQNVKSVGDINFNKGSFIDRVQNNELEHFNPKNELSLDLVKLLYAEGLSINDIKKYTGGINIYPSALKLGVPILSQQYAHVLKFSDKEYNERLTNVMSNSMKDAKERRAQNGEPVFIPRGPLTKEHKDHISEGLKKYYEENPQKAFDISKRQREFFEANPDKAELFTEVMELTWKKSYSLKKALSKHFGKELGRELNSAELNPLTIAGENKNVMKSFWDKNPWAKEEFSKNMTLAWAKVKENDIKFHTVKSFPEGFVREFEKWKKENGIEQKTELNHVVRNGEICGDSGDLTTTKELVDKFCDENVQIQNVMADVYSITAYDLAKCIEKETKGIASPANEGKVMLMQFINQELQELISNKKINPENGMTESGYVTSEEAKTLYQMACGLCTEQKLKPYLSFLHNKLDENYEKYSKLHLKGAN